MSNTINEHTQSKKIYLEAARVLAIFCVMFNHSGPRGSVLFTYTSNPITIYTSLIAAIYCQIGVPLFLMISGALLLGKQESIKKVFKKRILRIAIVLLIFSMIRYLYECFIVNSYSFSLIQFIKLFIQDSIFIPYWYLYTYIGILLLLPLLQNLINKTHKKDGIYFIVLCLIFSSIIPIINFYCHLSLAINLHVELVVFYFISGYILEILYDEKHRKEWFIGSLLMIILPLIYMFTLTVINGEYRGDGGHSCILELFYPTTMGTFIFLKSINWNNHPILSKAFIKCGELVFGVYLIEDYLRNLLAFIYDNLAPIISPMPACLVWLIAVFALGLLITRIFKLIPGLKLLL